MLQQGPAAGKGAHETLGRRLAARLGDCVDRTVLLAHRLACRMDATPPEFGSAGPVDESDGRAVRGEWLRCLRLWADYNPEEVFALKVGTILLSLTILGLWILIGMFH